MKTYKYHVNGIHCKSCIHLIEDKLNNLSEVSQVKASLNNSSVSFVGNFGDKSQDEIISYLNEILKTHGYTLSIDKCKEDINWNQFYWATPFAILFIVLFVSLQKLGIVNLINASDVSYSTAFIVGIVASLSTCMAVVGGLVLSVSASFAKENDKVRPQILFHVGRLISFFILGGAIGALGAVFQFGSTGTFILNLIIAIILLILGINLLDVFHWTKRIQPTIPSFIGKHVHGIKNINHTLTPFLLGIATFFLPCGFTQSMQIYTLTTGDFLTGALMMFVFALGTLPVLLILSFGSLGIHKKAQSGVFFKTSGLVVIFFGVYNLFNALVSIGIIPPVFNF